MNLKNAKILGYTTLPQASGLCFHCSTGIKHCVIVRDPESGENVTIGTSCAERVGVDNYALKNRLTSEQAKARKEKIKAIEDMKAEKFKKEMEIGRAKMEARKEKVGHIVEALRLIGDHFHTSLADQLTGGRLSYRQATFVCKAVVGGSGRRNKKNAEQWDRILDLSTS
jgi:hypothetical protein